VPLAPPQAARTTTLLFFFFFLFLVHFHWNRLATVRIAVVRIAFTVVLIQEKLDGITRTFKLELSSHFFEPALFRFVYALGH
jgi:hypothetical protein